MTIQSLNDNPYTWKDSLYIKMGPWDHLASIGIPIIQIWWSHYHLYIYNGNAIPGKMVFVLKHSLL